MIAILQNERDNVVKPTIKATKALFHLFLNPNPNINPKLKRY